MIDVELGSHRYIPPHPNGAAEIRQRVLEDLNSNEISSASRLGMLATGASRLREEYLRKVRHLFGPDSYERWRQYVADLRRREDERWLRRIESNMENREPISVAELRRLQEERLQESVLFLREIGVGTGEIQGVAQVVQQQLSDLLSASISLDEPSITPPEKVPLATLEMIRPPYPGFFSDSIIAQGSAGRFGSPEPFQVTFATGTTVSSGLIQASISVSNFHAGDGDGVIAFAESGVGFWYKMPRAGIVRAFIEMGAQRTHHRLSLADEWGWSNSFTQQFNAIIMRCTGELSDPQDEVATSISDFRVKGETNGTWNASPIPAGTTTWINLSSATSFPADSFVYVEIGTFTGHSVMTNDVSVNGDCLFEWIVKSIGVAAE